MKIMDKIKMKLNSREESVRNKAKALLYVGYKSAKGKLLEPKYKKLWGECNVIMKNEEDWKTHKYWEDTVLNKYFGKYVKGELPDDAMEIKKWLREFTSRLRRQEVIEEDRIFLRKRFVPFMQGVNEIGDFKALLKTYNLD